MAVHDRHVLIAKDHVHVTRDRKEGLHRPSDISVGGAIAWRPSDALELSESLEELGFPPEPAK